MRNICKVATCDKIVVGHGYCLGHYRRFRLYGDPEHVQQQQFHGLTVTERFWKYVQKTDSCWLWIGSKDKNGYGRLRVDKVPQLASRLSWKIHYGGIQKGKYVLHRCDNPSCVNPDHLYLGDQFDNMRDMWLNGRANPGHVFGVKHGNAKLNDDAVRLIRNSELSNYKLAKQIGVSEPTIRAVRKGLTWRHVE